MADAADLGLAGVEDGEVEGVVRGGVDGGFVLLVLGYVYAAPAGGVAAG